MLIDFLIIEKTIVCLYNIVIMNKLLIDFHLLLLYKIYTTLIKDIQIKIIYNKTINLLLQNHIQ